MEELIIKIENSRIYLMVNDLYKNHLDKVLSVGLLMFMIPAMFSNTLYFKADTIIDSIARILLSVIRWSGLGLLATKVLMDFIFKNTNRYICIFFGILSFVSIITTKDLTIAKLLLLILFVKDFDLKKFIRLNTNIQMLFMLFLLFSVSLGILDNTLMDTDRVRFSIGFDWVTYLPVLFFFVISMLIIYLDRNFTDVEFFLLLVAGLIMYIFTNARMAFIFTIVIIILGRIKCFDFIKKIKFNSVLKMMIIALPFILMLIALILSYLYSPSSALLKPVNSLLSGRLELMNDAVNTYGLTLFGQNIQWIGYGHGGIKGAYNFVDNSYLKFLLDAGIVTTFCMLAMYSFIVMMFIKNKDNCSLFIVVMIMLFCFLEPYLINVCFNPVILLVGILMNDYKLKAYK